MRWVMMIVCVVSFTSPCSAWWESGHHLISLLAYEQLSDEEQETFRTVLAAHPRFAVDFVLPANVNGEFEAMEWRIGRAGYWPDVARSQPAFDRPSWHYQLGATLVVGTVENVPPNPGPLPEGATLDSANLHLAQAVALSRNVLHDKTQPAADRAVALCWLIHLAGDAHQPCHAGSLYRPVVFPNGDRGANWIPTKQVGNLHALWDSLLGQQFDAGDIRRRVREIQIDQPLVESAQIATNDPDGLDPLRWLKESAEFGRSHVYTEEVLAAVEAAVTREGHRLEMIDLPEQYLKAAGRVARQRAAFAGFRLAAMLKKDL
ncbi:S1/P1 nuclease [Schlesneria paludicola]|uniref:S1/P1 nuclease n=1 Tax=Schlesneria paludicola TaxID=360056 RepID=UPI00029A0673|nr:S1/P1 nuclease [Schlesneria paludicola]